MSSPASVRLRYAVRDQVRMICESLDQLLPAEHPVRAVWGYVESLDLSHYLKAVGAVAGRAGAPAFDPRILVALWLQATLDGCGSARELSRLCEHHLVYRWICGDVPINAHTLADFRVGQVEGLDALLTQSAAVLCEAGVASLQRVAQDGMRVRANAGASSFRRGATLEKHLEEAREQVETLKSQVEEDAGAAGRRSATAKLRAQQERLTRLEEAQQELVKLQDANTQRAASSQTRHRAVDPVKVRVSETDPEARKMKMPDGGYRPAYNVQFSTTTEGGVVVGVDVTNAGSDIDQLEPMVEQLEERYAAKPTEVLVDGGFASLEAIDRLESDPTPIQVYAPVKNAEKELAAGKDPFAPKRRDTPGVAGWRQRMGTEPAKAIYKLRSSTAEWVNAGCRNRGLGQFNVVGLAKAKAVALWHGLVHNLTRSIALMNPVPAA